MLALTLFFLFPGLFAAYLAFVGAMMVLGFIGAAFGAIFSR